MRKLSTVISIIMCAALFASCGETQTKLSSSQAALTSQVESPKLVGEATPMTPELQGEIKNLFLQNVSSGDYVEAHKKSIN